MDVEWACEAVVSRRQLEAVPEAEVSKTPRAIMQEFLAYSPKHRVGKQAEKATMFC